MRTILIDDEVHALYNLEKILKSDFPEISIIGSFTKILEAIKAIKKFKPDLIFLDISMPEGSGFDLLEALGSFSCNVIFVTAYDQYAIHAIRHKAFDYLLKPVELDELRSCIDRLRLKNDTTRSSLDSNKLSISTQDSIEFIPLEDIVYITSQNSYTTIYRKSKPKLLTTKPIGVIFTLLPIKQFIRCHNSYIINKRFVNRFLKRDGVLELTTGTHIPIARAKKDVVLDWLQS